MEHYPHVMTAIQAYFIKLSVFFQFSFIIGLGLAVEQYAHVMIVALKYLCILWNSWFSTLAVSSSLHFDHPSLCLPTQWWFPQRLPLQAWYHIPAVYRWSSPENPPAERRCPLQWYVCSGPPGCHGHSASLLWWSWEQPAHHLCCTHSELGMGWGRHVYLIMFLHDVLDRF